MQDVSVYTIVPAGKVRNCNKIHCVVSHKEINIFILKLWIMMRGKLEMYDRMMTDSGKLELEKETPQTKGGGKNKKVSISTLIMLSMN